MKAFITFEGVEGSGKSTQIKLLEQDLAANAFSVVLTREPTGTPIGRKIGDILFNRSHSGMCPETELMLFFAARAQHVREVIEPALNEGKVVLCDRFSDATFAYQAAGRGLDADFVARVNDYCSRQYKPALTLLFDLPVEAGLARPAGATPVLTTLPARTVSSGRNLIFITASARPILRLRGRNRRVSGSLTRRASAMSSLPTFAGK